MTKESFIIALIGISGVYGGVWYESSDPSYDIGNPLCNELIFTDGAKEFSCCIADDERQYCEYATVPTCMYDFNEDHPLRYENGLDICDGNILDVECTFSQKLCNPETCCDKGFPVPITEEIQSCNDAYDSGHGCPSGWEPVLDPCEQDECTLDNCCRENLCENYSCPEGWISKDYYTGFCFLYKYNQYCELQDCCFNDPKYEIDSRIDANAIEPPTCLGHQEYLYDIGRPMDCITGRKVNDIACPITCFGDGECFGKCTMDFCCLTCEEFTGECPIGTSFEVENTCLAQQCTENMCCVSDDSSESSDSSDSSDE